MRIAVNTRLLIENKLDGIGWFTYETLKRITNEHSDIEFLFIFDRPYSDKFVFSSNVRPVIIGPPSRHPFLWYIWFEYSIPKILKKYKVDLFLSPDGYLSLSTKIPSISIIHDINFHHRPKDLPFLKRNYYCYFFPKFAQKAKRIGTVSNYSKNDIINSYKVDVDKIDVFYNGVNQQYKPTSNESKTLIKEKFTEGKDYFLFIGNLHPRKNVGRLLSAFDLFKKETKNSQKLLIIGEEFFKTSEIKNTYKKLQFKNDVIFMGRQSPEVLGDIIGASMALTFVPLFEGFGIPNIEAMYCDVPVITSNVTAIPEVVGDAALLINPLSIEEIKNAMIKVYSDEKYRSSLIEKGKEQCKQYSWDKTANDLWKCIEKCL